MQQCNHPYDLKQSWQELSTQKKLKVPKETLGLDLSKVSIEIHFSTWCPDCERELTDLFSLTENMNQPPKFTFFSYEDKQDYRDKKSQGLLTIKCLPTLIFTRDNSEFLRIEEDSKGALFSMIEKSL